MSVIYTDGSCIGNPGPGGWAFCLIENGNEYMMSGNEENTTNNRMELRAVIESLKLLSSNSCEIFSDSELTIKCAQGIYKRKKNISLWEEYKNVAKNINIKWTWVKAHNGNKYNELVDSMARGEARLLV